MKITFEIDTEKDGEDFPSPQKGIKLQIAISDMVDKLREIIRYTEEDDVILFNFLRGNLLYSQRENILLTGESDSKAVQLLKDIDNGKKKVTAKDFDPATYEGFTEEDKQTLSEIREMMYIFAIYIMSEFNDIYSTNMPGGGDIHRVLE